MYSRWPRGEGRKLWNKARSVLVNSIQWTLEIDGSFWTFQYWANCWNRQSRQFEKNVEIDGAESCVWLQLRKIVSCTVWRTIETEEDRPFLEPMMSRLPGSATPRNYRKFSMQCNLPTVNHVCERYVCITHTKLIRLCYVSYFHAISAMYLEINIRSFIYFFKLNKI